MQPLGEPKGDKPVGATERQVNYAKALVREKLANEVDANDFVSWYMRKVGNTKRDVSELIEMLNGNKEGLDDLVKAYLESEVF